MGTKEHGALGSNQPLERVPPPSAANDENIETFGMGPEENAEEQEVLPVASQKVLGDDVVYLREDLRPR